MSQAETLLKSIAEEDWPTVSYPHETEPVIVIDENRVIHVPDELKRIAVQYDHNIEHVEFRCPRYWDEHDMSKMAIYINVKTPDNKLVPYAATSVIPNSFDEKLMSFRWTITRDITQVKGQLTFLVCIKKTDNFGLEVNHWNSELNKEMYISEGLECNVESILDAQPALVTDILTRLNEVESKVSAAGSGSASIKTNVVIPGGETGAESWLTDSVTNLHYVDISIPGVTSDHSAIVILRNMTADHEFTAKCIEGAIRIYSKSIPTSTGICDIVYGLTANETTELTSTLPAGRAKGDVNGDGLITEADSDIILTADLAPETLTDPVDIWAADVNGDDLVDSIGVSILLGYIDETQTGLTEYSQYAADYYGNWSWDAEKFRYYYDISVPGITATSAASVSIDNPPEGIEFDTVCITDAIRVYSKSIPTAELTCNITYSSTVGPASVIVIGSTDNTGIATPAIELDTTLSVEGMAADAKAVGDALGNISAILDAINGEVI